MQYVYTQEVFSAVDRVPSGSNVIVHIREVALVRKPASKTG